METAKYKFRPISMYSDLLDTEETFNKRDPLKEYEKRFYERHLVPSLIGENRLIHTIEYTGGYDENTKVRFWERFYTYSGEGNTKSIFVHQIEFYDMTDLYGEFEDEEVYRRYTEGNELVEFDKYYKVVTDADGKIIVDSSGQYELVLYREDGPAYIEYFDEGVTISEDSNRRGKVSCEKYYQRCEAPPLSYNEEPYRIENSLPHTIVYDMERQFDNTYKHYVFETIPSMEDEETLLDIFNSLSDSEKNKFKELKNLEKYTRENMEKLTDEEAAYLIVETENISDRQYKHYIAIAKIFLRKYIKITSNEKRRLKKQLKQQSTQIDIIDKFPETYLNFRGKIVPELLKGFMGTYRIPLSFILDDIESGASRYSPSQKEAYCNITTVDFSKNDLLDYDALMLAKVITKLSEISKEELTINLSDNRFHGLLPLHSEPQGSDAASLTQYKEKLDPYLFEILRLEKVSILILTKNPIVTDGGRHDFFIRVFKENLLHKLIYDVQIPEVEQIKKVFVDSGHLTEMTEEEQESFIKITTEAHSKFYN